MEEKINDSDVLLWNFSTSIDDLILSGYTVDGIKYLLNEKLKEVGNEEVI